MDTLVQLRQATQNDVGFLLDRVIDAAIASGVDIHRGNLSAHADAYQYVEGFPKDGDLGIIAETLEGDMVGAVWIRLLQSNAHAIHEHLPELTIAVISDYQGKGIGKRLMEKLYSAASAMGISKISLGVHKDNMPAINLYKKDKWKEDGRFKDYIMMSRKTDA